MNLNLKKQHFAPLIIVSAAIIIILAVFTVMKAVDISETSAAIEEEERIYESNEEKFTRLAALSLMSDELKESYNRLNKLLPENADEAGLIQHISKLSLNAGINLESIEFDERVVNNNMNVMPVTFSVKGSYSRFVSLMKSIAGGDRLIRFEKIEITRGDTDADGVTVNIRADAFYR